ncbi:MULTISPECIES: SH3 domain-containing protein [unclassified Mammaliicoccus]|uniref:SH3 domain-containing protein n=1 Tax=unclassified Mammaliicoccus TaxID=2803851 RepID=UPI001EFBA7AF|nr:MULTISPECIES: SH3 domain-containing protein [unclassified Mammaliicoccus]
MTAKLTQKEAVKYALSMVGKGYDYDNAYGWQCFDTANYYWHQLFGHGLKGNGAADIPTHNDFKGEATVYENTKSFLAKPGDLVIFNRNYGGGYGHVSIVVDATLDQLDVVEQNWLGGGLNKTEVTTRRKHNYDFPMWFIRPNFKAEVKKATTTKKATVKKEVAKKESTKKGKTLKYNRDEVTGYKLPKRGYKPKFVVIHNDAGSLSAMQYHDSLVNAPLSRLENGIAHSYISGNTVWQALPEGRTAWHTANQYGNTNGYGIEVCQSMSASDKDFLASEQSAFQEAARMLKKWGLPVDRNTVRLHNEFSATQCPHRSMKLHAGYTSTQRAPQSVVDKTKDYFISQIKAYYDGKIPTGTKVSTSKKTSSNTSKNVSSGKWQKNQYGTWWMKESATFTCGGSPILARINSPFLSAQEGYWFQPGGYVNYDEVCIQDGHVWIGYTWKGVRYYLPIRTAKGTPPNHSVGQLWGTIK